MRCPECNKFVSFEPADPEISSSTDELEEGETTVEAEIHIALNCAECGTELKSSDLQLAGDFDFDPEAHKNKGKEETHELTVEWGEPEFTDRNETHTKERQKMRKGVPVLDAKGKPIMIPGRPIKYRYQRRFYGAQVNCSLECKCQNDSLASIDLSDEVQASGMEESC